MEDINRILAVSWVTQYCKGTVHSAVSLAAKYSAELAVIHVIDTLWLKGWNLPMKLHEEERRKEMERIKADLDGIISREKKGGMKIKTIIKEGDPVEEILKVIEKEKIDLVIMRAHEESRIEHFLVGGSNDAIIRKMPCSIYLLKNEPGQKVD
ncbi:MAG: universal stress protein [Smithella sp.]|jgi:nucleotide-binding universal stress UspA family protein